MGGVTMPMGAARLGAFRRWPDDRTGQAWRAVMEADHPAAIQAAIAQAERFELIRSSHSEPCECHAVLDVVDVAGDLIGDWCIPTVEAFDRLAAFLGLRCTSWDAFPYGGLNVPGLLDRVTPRSTGVPDDGSGGG